MFFELCKHRWLKTIRSVTLGRKLIGGIILGFIGLILLANILALGLGMKTFIQTGLHHQNVVGFLNTWILFFFLFEILYRFLIQKVSGIELESYLHLPIKRSKIAHFLLGSSFISTLNIVVLLLFVPITMTTISSVYGLAGAISWLLTILGISWSLHWFMCWFKQKYGEKLTGILIIFAIFLSGIGAASYGIFNVGQFTEPFFEASLHRYWVPLLSFGICFGAYFTAFTYYKKHAYLEELQKKENQRWTSSSSITLFDRFGLAGEVANLELKLILRHKRSRFFLGISLLFLLYGLIFYTDKNFASKGISFLYIFIGVFITGNFIMNYGQLFLSWNSSHLDFFLSRENGIESLVTGKYILLSGVSAICFLLSIPYVYFGWNILFVHLATFLFNMGINIHIVIYLALWNPKPIDLDRGGLFNYEGMGASQFLMAFPILFVPYLVYLPFALWVGADVGLFVLGAMGLLGIIFYKRLTQFQVNRLLNNRYKTSASFRREL